VGQELIGGLTLAPVKNGCFYEVLAAHPTHLEIKPQGGGVEFVSLQLAQRALRPAHALTLASCQGLTLRGRVRVLDTEKPYFSEDYRKLFVALSRATAFDLVEVV